MKNGASDMQNGAMVNTTASLTGSTLKMFTRNRQAMFFTLFVPIIIMTVFGLLGLDRVPKTDVGLAVSSPTAATTEFIDQLKKIEAFAVTVGLEADERAALEKGDRAVVFIIPDALMPAGDQPPSKQTVTALVNIGERPRGYTAVSVVQQILDKTNLGVAQAPELFAVKTETVNARNLKYIDFLLPGIVALAIMQMSVFSVAFLFTDYKEKGILKRLLATPMRPRQFVTANIITRLIVAVVQAALLIAVGVWLFKAHVIGSIWLLLPAIVLGGIMFLSMGFVISGISKTVESVPAIANLVIFPMFFLGGTFFPPETMPIWLQHIVQYLPLTYLSDALREVMTNGSGWSAVAPDLAWMAAWSAVLVLLATFTFGFEEKRVG